MGNMMGCFGRSTTPDLLPEILTPNTSSGISGRNASGKGYSESSSSGYSGFSFGDQLSVGETSPSGELLEKPNLRIFSFAELKNATKNFKSETLLGEGGFGRVYKGWIDEKGSVTSKSGLKLAVAIKKLNSESMQGFEEWQSEVNFLGRLSHPNLVKLLGYCWEDKELLLVYEYLPKGSLENHLFRRNTTVEPLSWNRRMSIALGVARGLAFLHNSDKQVIYRDFKASNILLDVNYDAKISDFGLAKLGPSVGNSHVTTRVMGTYGYAAPEYVATGHLYVNSDIYGFGVVLLEMLTGLRAVDLNRPKGQQNLVEWMGPYLSNNKKLRIVMDSRLEGQYSLKAAFELAQHTLKCLRVDHRTRPSMKEAVEVLQKVEAIKVKENRGRPGEKSPSNDKKSDNSRRSPYHPRHRDPRTRMESQSPKER
ncbi:probable serine/threonine-protein kinase PIX13 [Chenopodium quinoa]|uniref:non-specific serine/threonine protein kinase n=1 Tax=Chenopodium quinoa TaxID=63459 RepID=A0A803MHJ5_CHEQI|nr:probable serine/threonine-protein kinase PIX13 [Chenopodium quinoa]